MKLKNDISELETICGSVDRFCETHGLTPKNSFDLNLVLDEVFTNIVSYGFQDRKEHLIRIDISMEKNAITIRVSDDGAPFDPTKAAKADVTCSLDSCRIGGLGLHLIHRIMNEVVYERKNNKNILILKKRLDKNE